MAGISPSGESELHGSRMSTYPVLEIAEEKRSKRNPRQLDFTSAMDEFQKMFPSMDPELIESVLRANNGAVDDTIDQLLKISLDTDPSTNDQPPPILPPKPPGSLRSSNERLASDQEPSPALPPREGSLKRKSKPHKKSSPSNTILRNIPKTQYDTEWNGMIIPMLGKLPADFLRLKLTDSPPPRPPKSVSTKHRSQSLKHHLPLHLAEQTTHKKSSTLHNKSSGLLHTHRSRHGHITTSVGERLSSNVLKRQIEANQRRLQESLDPNEIDSDADRFLEDERLALIMQNEEFLRELKRNEDFMRTLEFERDLLASRLAHEQKKNRHLAQLSPSAEKTPNWMAPRPSERDDTSLAPTLSPTTEECPQDSPVASDRNSVFSEPLSPSAVPVDRTDKNEVHDFRDQLKSMGASSKKKFAVLARRFFATARKKRKGTGKIVRNAHGPSTLNLLEDNDDEDLIDASGSLNIDRDNILFEPLPNAWTSSPFEEDKDQRQVLHDGVTVEEEREWV